MAEKTDMTELPERANGGGSPPLYDKFFDGAVWRLTMGEDTRTTNTQNVQQIIYKRAKTLGIRVSVHVESPTTILVQKTSDSR